MGDFNIDPLLSGSFDIMNTVFSNNFFPAITMPAQVGGSSTYLIDNIFTNNRPFSNFTSGIYNIFLKDSYHINVSTNCFH